jgi:hypothetical protein
VKPGRFVRLCLRGLPPDFRDKYGREIELDYASSRSGRLRLAADVLRVRLLLHRAGRRTAPSPVKRRSPMLESLFLDLRQGARSLAKRPAFALLAVATLGLGIGAVTSVFSVVNGVLLRPLSYASPDRIVILWRMDIVR